ncbi:MAG: phosphatase PAP2 family protein [Ectothiorhodospiraceae bacterium]|nr:phosphatase PAP2 family protein [Ectothiorhodospiraceae bacterium]
MDEYLLLLLNQTLATPWLDVFFAWISQHTFFSTPLLLLVLVFFAWRFGKDGVKFWFITILLITLGDQLGVLLKDLTAQARPCAALGDTVRQVNTVFSINCSRRLNGMPSNHALNFFIFATFSAYVLRWRSWCWSFGILAALVALSRVYLGVHYPSQILAGAALGTGLGLLAGWWGMSRLALVQRIAQSSNKSD